MKGKKADATFISEFVLNCAKQKIFSPESIAAKAQLEIEEIDNKLKKIADLKRKRSKLVDVISSFKIKGKDMTEDKQLLQFYQISDLSLAAKLCKALPILDKVEFFNEVLGKESLFIAKQLGALKILKTENLKLVPAERYNEFSNFLKERHLK